MNRLSKALLPYILPVFAVAVVALGYAQYSHASSGQLVLCKQPYALCTSARCIPHPGSHNKAICSCDVEDGLNMATVPCNTVSPRTAHGAHIIYSEFSLVQAIQGKESMFCPSGDPWTNCLNSICTVDPHNPRRAFCICDILRTGEFTTFGGDCNTATCKNGYWSGATLSTFQAGVAFMVKAMNLTKSPVKFCPAQP